MDCICTAETTVLIWGCLLVTFSDGQIKVITLSAVYRILSSICGQYISSASTAPKDKINSGWGTWQVISQEVVQVWWNIIMEINTVNRKCNVIFSNNVSVTWKIKHVSPPSTLSMIPENGSSSSFVTICRFATRSLETYWTETWTESLHTEFEVERSALLRLGDLDTTFLPGCVWCRVGGHWVETETDGLSVAVTFEHLQISWWLKASCACFS